MVSFRVPAAKPAAATVPAATPANTLLLIHFVFMRQALPSPTEHGAACCLEDYTCLNDNVDQSTIQALVASLSDPINTMYCGTGIEVSLYIRL